MADDLRRFLENKTILARRPSLVERGAKWARRHVAMITVAATAFAGAAIACLVAGLMTLEAYRSEARQRSVAEANLSIASELIDSVLSQAAGDRYWHGDLKRAETLAAETTKFYERLLEHSDDPELRFRAAKAHGSVAHIWQLVGRHEKAAIANRRASELLVKLITADPDQPKYLAALASNYNRVGLVDWSLDQMLAAEPAWRQAWAIWSELADLHPQEFAYQEGLACTLSNLGAVCSFTDRSELAEEYYHRAEIIAARLPAEFKCSAEGLASQAGSCTIRAELARLRGQYDQALELLKESVPLHQQSLAKWPTNPVALQCYYHTCWSIVDCQLGAGRHKEAAAAVERLIELFPDRLQAYHEATAQLLRCATIAGDKAGHTPADELKLLPQGSSAESPSQAYRRRAHELVDKSRGAHHRTPEAADRFAWFLLTCDDESFRDAPRALELAQGVVAETPARNGVWFTLALAHYRNGNWQAAENTDQSSIKLSPGGNANAYDWLLLSMIRAQQGRLKDAQQHLNEARTWIAAHNPKEAELSDLAAEADELIRKTAAEPTSEDAPKSSQSIISGPYDQLHHMRA
ncbi:MAG: hypothetical protein H0T51_17320 [Pirellulales bacterium]|nr:hypothetical protein [Pirellulales bacterium]